jgi:hypothetical protein
MLTGYEVPSDAWENISAVHNAESGHGGVERTLRKLDEKNLNWDKILEHVPKNFTGADFYGLTSKAVMAAAERTI